MSSSLDALFYKEFYDTMRARSSRCTLDLFKLGVPDLGERPANAKKVLLRGIQDEYYGKLNKSVAMLWTKPKLVKRKYGSDGKFLLDKNNQVKTEDITLPRDCVAVVSDLRLGVPLSHKTTEDFKYVDFFKTRDNKVKYVYIIPRKYCFSVEETALILCSRPMRAYYEGMSVFLQNGHRVYLYVVPFKVTSAPRSYRVLKTKVSTNYSSEIDCLISTWTRYNMCFSKKLTQLSEPVRDTSNVAYKVLGSTLDEYIPYSDKSLEITTTDVTDFIL
jgi:hypothetical protein